MTSTILLTEQASAQVLRIDDVGKVLASWAPPARSCWALPNEAKLRSWQGTPVLLVTDSFGFAGVFDDGGTILWSADVTRAADPHSIELLSAGALAVAGAEGNWVRVYSGLAGANELHAHVPLPGAHGLAWDEPTATLWAIGHRDLVSWRWNGSDLRETSRRALPSREGHDLIWSDQTHQTLWLTTRTGAYAAYVSDGWGAVPGPVSAGVDVKSVGRASDGRVIYTRAQERWWTDTVHFLEPSGTVVLEGARIYKARWEDWQ